MTLNDLLPYRANAHYVLVTSVSLVAVEREDLEDGETPEAAAVRQLQAGMGSEARVDASAMTAAFVHHSGERGEMFGYAADRLGLVFEGEEPDGVTAVPGFGSIRL